MCHLSGRCSDTPLNCALNVPIKLHTTTECSEVGDLVVSKYVSAVGSEMACTGFNERARVVVRVLHCEMTVLCRQCLSLSARVLLSDTLDTLGV